MNRTTERFIRDMTAADLRVWPYHGRFWWKGPAVDVDDLQDALSATKVKCQWDNLGMGYVVYPHESDEDWFEQQQEVDDA